MLERVLRLFPIESFCADVRAVMSDYILRIFEKHPGLVVDLKKDLLDFISDRNNVGEGREEVSGDTVLGAPRGKQREAASSSEPALAKKWTSTTNTRQQILACSANKRVVSPRPPPDPSLARICAVAASPVFRPRRVDCGRVRRPLAGSPLQHHRHGAVPRGLGGLCLRSEHGDGDGRGRDGQRSLRGALWVAGPRADARGQRCASLTPRARPHLSPPERA